MEGILAWVQAGVALAALWVAVKVVAYQSKLRGVERLEAVCGVASAAASVLYDAALIARGVPRTPDGPINNFPMSRFVFTGQALASTPLHELRSPEFQAYVIDLQQLIAEAWADFETMRQLPSGETPPFWFGPGMTDFALDAGIITDELRLIAEGERRALKRVWL